MPIYAGVGCWDRSGTNASATPKLGATRLQPGVPPIHSRPVSTGLRKGRYGAIRGYRHIKPTRWRPRGLQVTLVRSGAAKRAKRVVGGTRLRTPIRKAPQRWTDWKQPAGTLGLRALGPGTRRPAKVSARAGLWGCGILRNR